MPGVRQANWVPSDLLLVARPDGSSKCSGKELASETYAKDRLAQAKRFFDEPDLVFQERVVTLLVDAHRSTHQDQAARTTWARWHRMTFKRRHDLCGVPCSVERILDSSERLARSVLHDKDSTHKFLPQGAVIFTLRRRACGRPCPSKHGPTGFDAKTQAVLSSTIIIGSHFASKCLLRKARDPKASQRRAYPEPVGKGPAVTKVIVPCESAAHSCQHE